MFHIEFQLGAPSQAVSDESRLRSLLRSSLDELSVLSGEEHWATIDKWRVTRFVQLAWPTCKNEEDARLLCAWMAWFHQFDDEFDSPSVSRDPLAVEALVGPYLGHIAKALAGQSIDSTVRGGPLKAFIELNRWTVEPMSQAWHDRWFNDLADYVRTYVAEATHRATGTVLSPEELIKHKRVSMAQRSSMSLIERVATGELSPGAHSLTSTATDMVSDITGAVNDLKSLARERACGDTHNLIISLVHHRSISEREAIEHLDQFVQTRCRDLAHAIQEIPTHPTVQHERETVAEWLVNCGRWVRGYNDWLLDTGRYDPAPAEVRTEVPAPEAAAGAGGGGDEDEEDATTSSTPAAVAPPASKT
jgi:hypothetical protein